MSVQSAPCSTDPAGSVHRPGTTEKDREATSNLSKTKRAAFYSVMVLITIGLGFAMAEGAVRLTFSGPDTANWGRFHEERG